MKPIREAFDMEIKAGYLNWEKLDKMLHTALFTVDNKFTSVRDDTGEVKEMRTTDTLDFFGKSISGAKASYRVYHPRFTNGKLMCTGIQIGTVDLEGQPFYTNPPVMF